MYNEIIEKLDQLLLLQHSLLNNFKALQQSEASNDEWLDNTDVKRLLKISDSSLYRLRKKQLLPCKRIAGKWYYSRLAIAAIINA